MDGKGMRKEKNEETGGNPIFKVPSHIDQFFPPPYVLINHNDAVV